MNGAPAALDPAALAGFRRLASAAARAAGEVARRAFRGALQVRLKADRSEVSDADEAAQAAAIAVIHAARPADAFITEEALAPHPAHAPPSNAGVCWVIDPIDGTRNFVRGIPWYAASVGALFAGLPVAGAVYDPSQDVLYAASTVEPLFVNDQPRSAGAARRDRPNGLNPRLVVGTPSLPSGPVATIAHDWLERHVCRNFGSTALHLAMVAIGELDGMIADNPKLWDLAAGAVLVARSGGRLTSPWGQPLFPVDVATYAGEEMPSLAATLDAHPQLVQAPR